MDLWEVSGSLSFSFLVWMLIWYLNGINSSLFGILEVGYVIAFLDAKPQRTRRRRKPHQLVLWVGLSARLGLNPNLFVFLVFFLKAVWHPGMISAWSPPFLEDFEHGLLKDMIGIRCSFSWVLKAQQTRNLLDRMCLRYLEVANPRLLWILEVYSSF